MNYSADWLQCRTVIALLHLPTQLIRPIISPRVLAFSTSGTISQIGNIFAPTLGHNMSAQHVTEVTLFLVGRYR
jgi:hypothetical protein